MTARQSLVPIHEEILAQLVQTLSIISKNPSNPNFDQYLFESLSALIRYLMSKVHHRLLIIFPKDLLLLRSPMHCRILRISYKLSAPPCYSRTLNVRAVLHDMIVMSYIKCFYCTTEFVPYVFQILSQMLELHSGPIPIGYRSLLPLILTPAPWAQKGSIPGLVRYIKACLMKDGAEIAKSGQFSPMLAVAQQRLIPSKINDNWGFELLQAVIRYIPLYAPPLLIRENLYLTYAVIVPSWHRILSLYSCQCSCDYKLIKQRNLQTFLHISSCIYWLFKLKDLLPTMLLAF